MNPKDGYAVSDCKDFRAKQVLEFLIPIMYPEKPTRVTMTVGNTIWSADGRLTGGLGTSHLRCGRPDGQIGIEGQA